jgi:hypothetical protein
MFYILALFGLAAVLATLKRIGQLFPNHLVTLHPARGMKVVKTVLNTVGQVSLLGSVTKYA